MIRLVLADDQALVRDGLKLLLELEPDIMVAGIAENGLQALNMAKQHKPDIVLMDLNMPEMNGAEATRAILKELPNTKILVLTTYTTDQWINDALNAGAQGFLLKDTPREDLIRAVKGTVEGKNFLDPQIAGSLLKNREQFSNEAPSWLNELNDRELAVLKCLAQGLNNQQIAASLFLSEGTVRNYVSSLLAKLEVQDRTQAAILGVKSGLGNSK